MNNNSKILELIACDIMEVQAHERRNLAIIMSRPLYNCLFDDHGFKADLHRTLFGIPLEVVNNCGYWWSVGVKRYANLEDINTDE